MGMYTILAISFRDLQNYTTLKQQADTFDSLKGFRDLQNYTTLKPMTTTGAAL